MKCYEKQHKPHFVGWKQLFQEKIQYDLLLLIFQTLRIVC